MALSQLSLLNQLLRGLSKGSFEKLAPALEYVSLPRDFVLARKGQPIVYCYFMESGIASIVVQSPENHRVEAGIYGRDGFGPASIINGVLRSHLDQFIQVAGDGHRIAVSALIPLLSELPDLSAALHFFAHVLALQTTHTALSNAVHHVDERLARWLLMCHDRTSGDEISLTHEFIAMMLAVRRPSVTTALHVLEGNRFITAERGFITVRNRDGLEHFAADAYGAPEAEYFRLLEPNKNLTIAARFEAV